MADKKHLDYLAKGLDLREKGFKIIGGVAAVISVASFYKAGANKMMRQIVVLAKDK